MHYAINNYRRAEGGKVCVSEGYKGAEERNQMNGGEGFGEEHTPFLFAVALATIRGVANCRPLSSQTTCLYGVWVPSILNKKRGRERKKGKDQNREEICQIS